MKQLGLLSYSKFMLHSVKAISSNNLPCRHLALRNICISKTQFTQITPVSHPHLLKTGEIVPGIKAEEFKNRRQKLMEMLRKHSAPAGSNSAHLVVIPSSSPVYMSENIPYFYRQHSDVLYLSGFNEPNCALALYSKSSKNLTDYESVMFVPKQSEHSEIWEGKKLDLDSVVNFLGVDKALHMEEFEKFLESFTKEHKQFIVWYDFLNAPFRPLHEKMRNFVTSFSGGLRVQSPQYCIHQMRLIKSKSEIELMRKTCKIAAQSMKEVLAFGYPQIPESHLEAKMDYECQLRGANHLSFPPVVGGADRAKTIHYIDNNQIVDDNEMVLMDAGCEYYGYSSDMARTWPVNGKYTVPQRDVYEMVLSVQEELIELCRSKMTLDHLFDIMCKKLGKGLQSIGAIPSSVTEEKLSEIAFKFCPHHVSHYLGMDVHDTHLISRNIELQPGMVVTVEPGIYISKCNKEIPEKYRGICVRIEDDILITDDGYENLTADCPKHIEEIEALFKKC